MPTEAYFRRSATDALPQDLSAIPALIACLDTGNVDARRIAADTLGRLDPVLAVAAVPELIIRLGNSESRVRCAAAQRTWELGTSRRAGSSGIDSSTGRQRV